MTNDGVGRPSFPKRAVVTAGMPYGNKELHFGHVGGVFVHADIFARFLRDRIGKENVIFVSGTDCYGATIEAGFEQAVANGFCGALADYVAQNHERQKETLSRYRISLDLFGASAEAGYSMDAVLRVRNCLYAHYVGPMSQSGLASQKLNIMAFEHELELTGTVYTIFVNQDEDEGVVDTFMETK